ncbi:MAG: cupin domain-containing protein [Verrucomicrobiota bacterium]
MQDLDFLQPVNVGKGLTVWRNRKGLTRKDIAKNSQTKSRNPFVPEQVGTFERGKGFSYARLVNDILPAYGISDVRDFDLFIDFCRGYDLSDVNVIHERSNLKHAAEGTEEFLVDPDDLPRNRSRISVIRIKPGMKTTWQCHEGHEYVMVSKGTLKAEFGIADDGRRDTYELKEGAGVAFPSMLHHSFHNIGEKEAEIIVARPTKSLPKGMGR